MNNYIKALLLFFIMIVISAPIHIPPVVIEETGGSSYVPSKITLGKGAFSVSGGQITVEQLGHHDWQKSLVITTATGGLRSVHDMITWRGKLWIATGKGVNGTGRGLILSYDINTGVLTTEFDVPVDAYTNLPYWRWLKVFKGKLYAALGNDTDAPTTVNTGDIYQYDGTTWTKVLDTNEKDIYALEIYREKLYAGGGTIGGGAGKLWSSPDGTTWTLINTFTSDSVRSLTTWRGKLRIGLKSAARLWSYDGVSFVDNGVPAGISLQVKSLVPYHGLLYLGCVGAKIYSWDESAFTLELDATATDDEIYHGEVYQDSLYFPTNAKAPNTVIVWKYDGTSWTQDYVATDTGLGHSLREYNGWLWLGTGQQSGQSLTLRKTKKINEGTGTNVINYWQGKIDADGKVNLIDISNPKSFHVERDDSTSPNINIFSENTTSVQSANLTFKGRGGQTEHVVYDIITWNKPATGNQLSSIRTLRGDANNKGIISFLTYDTALAERARILQGGGLKLASGTKPTCDSTVRGTLFYVAGGAGVKDTFEVCAKDAADAYAWRVIY